MPTHQWCVITVENVDFIYFSISHSSWGKRKVEINCELVYVLSVFQSVLINPIAPQRLSASRHGINCWFGWPLFCKQTQDTQLQIQRIDFKLVFTHCMWIQVSPLKRSLGSHAHYLPHTGVHWGSRTLFSALFNITKKQLDQKRWSEWGHRYAQSTRQIFGEKEI